MSKCSGKGHISKAKIICKPKSCVDELETERSPKTGPLLEGIVDLPQFIKHFGPKQKQILTNFIPSLTIFGITSLILITYLTEWKAVLQYVPFYRGKYFEDREGKN